MLVVRRSRLIVAGLFGARRVLGMGRIFFGVLGVDRLVMAVFVVNLGRGSLDGGRIGQGYRRQRLTDMGLRAPLLIMLAMGMAVIMRVVLRVIMAGMIMIMACMIVMPGIVMMMLGLMRVVLTAFGVQVLMLVMFLALLRRGDLHQVGAGVLDDLALHPLATAAAALVAVARTAATVAGTIFGFFLSLAMGAFVGLDQRLTVGNRNLIIIGMDFAEGQEAMAVAAILDEGRLQRGLHPCDLGEVDIAAQLLALGGFEIKFLDAIAADHNDPGLFRVGSIDQHFVGHFATHDGGGRV
jgi:hypothetical protein